MLRISLSALAATAMLTGVAFAQTSATTTTTTTTITPQQETQMRTYVTKEKTKSVAVPSGFTLSNGATVPQAVELHSFGSDAGMSHYRYTVMDNRTVVVDPSTRKVIKIIE